MKALSFWSWFTANEKRLRSINTISEREKSEVLHWFSVQLKYYCLEIGQRLSIPIDPDQPARLDFTFSNEPHVRALILQLMETAPDLPNWRFSASVNALAEGEPDYFEKEYCMNGICCKPSNIKFWIQHYNPTTEKVTLGIILDPPTDNMDPQCLHDIITIILIDTLGELLYERFILKFNILSHSPQEVKLLGGYELNLYLEGL